MWVHNRTSLGQNIKNFGYMKIEKAKINTTRDIQLKNLVMKGYRMKLYHPLEYILRK